jgi:hypothetical protein
MFDVVFQQRSYNFSTSTVLRSERAQGRCTIFKQIVLVLAT